MNLKSFNSKKSIELVEILNPSIALSPECRIGDVCSRRSDCCCCWLDLMMNVGYIILGVGGSIGMTCSLLTLWIIYRRDNWNAYIQLLVMLAFSQLLYDMSTVMVMFPGYSVEYAYIAIRSMSGLWATFLTNVISFIIVYTVWTLTPISVSSHLSMIRILIFGPSSLLGILVPMTLFSSSNLAFTIVSQIYYWARILSIIFNITSYLALVYKLKAVIKYTSTLNIQKNNITSHDGNPLASLVKRFKYYPIVQVLSRVCVAYYEEIYGHDYEYYHSFTIQKKIATLLYLITLPSAGLGFFIVFLVVSPGAIKLLKDDWNYLMTKLFGEVCYDRFRRRLSSTYQDGDPIFPIPPVSRPSTPADEDGLRLSDRSAPSELSWHESSNPNSTSGSDSSKRRTGRGRYDELDEDELSSEITRLYSTSSSGLRHYSLSTGYDSTGSGSQPKKVKLLVESLLKMDETSS